MGFKIFYAWQSDRDKTFNQNFIGDCLKEALKRLKKKYKDESPDFYLDRDSKDVPGYPNIPLTIFKKIEACDLFIGDLTVIGHIEKEDGKSDPQLNNNVFGELNYAISAIGEERIINVINIAYGKPGDPEVMPFDVLQRRFPIQYELSAKNVEEIKVVAEKLTVDLYNAIQLIFTTEHERNKKENQPFDTWKSWNDLTEKEFNFEVNEYIQTQINTIQNAILVPRSIVRVLGLSGLGKTNLLLECFRPGTMAMTNEVCNQVLYANMNECDENAIKAKTKEIFSGKEKKIIILDNCGLPAHEKIKEIVCNSSSEMSLITISPEPNESQQEIDLEGKTVVIKLEAREFRPIVQTLLEKNFTELTKEEVELFVDYSNGLPFYAVLMAKNKEQAKQQPGTLTNTSILGKLLGPLYNNEENKLIILATSIFTRFGYFNENESQLIAIAQSQALCPINETDGDLRVRKFKEICEQMQERGLLEKVGFSLSFRPTPLAVRLAEEWWRNCTVQKFKEILPVLQANGLVEKFCQQFRFLKHVAHAKEIVADLCKGVFNSAEVLDTEEGSRIFRSFVNVNPLACAKTITNAFGHLSKETIIGMYKGRRNLVWALEQLCYREDTFDSSIKIMAAFAVAENENIANNATQQFLQLFHIFLPGTTVNLQKRWDIIEYCLQKDDDYKQLAIQAAMRALKTESFRRMGGPEDEQQPGDYRPAPNEIMEYWSKAISLLEEYLVYPQYTTMITEHLINSLYGLSSQFAGNLIIPVIERLLEKKAVDWLTIRNKVKQILRSGNIFDQGTIDALNRLLDQITPDDFIGKLKMIVVRPSTEDYFAKDEEQDGKLLSKKINELAAEFLKAPEQWEAYLAPVVTGQVSEGINFGKELGSLIKDQAEMRRLIQLLLTLILNTDPANRNIGVLVGFLRTLKSKEVLLETFDTVLNTPNLQFLAFNIASGTELPFDYIGLIINLIEIGSFDVKMLSVFNFGWGLKHLGHEEARAILERISKINKEGEALAFSIAYSWSYNDDKIWDVNKDFLRHLLIQDGELLLNAFSRTQDQYYWSESVRKLLRENHDDELAELIINLIIAKSNDWDSFAGRSDFYNILDVIQERYFDQLWSALETVFLDLEEYSAALFHFKDLLGAKHDYYAKTEGILFKGEPKKFNTIFEWSKSHQNKSLYWIAEMLPVFNNDQTATSKWHPYALKFINELGNIKEVLSGISAKIGTYSWVGSVLDRYDLVKAMFTELIDHPILEVREWAEGHLKNTESMIAWEKNHESEMGF